MNEADTQTQPLKERLAQKGRELMETGKVTSEIVASLGEIPNQHDFLNHPAIKGRKIGFLLADNGQGLEFTPQPDYANDDPGGPAAWEVLAPVCAQMVEDYRKLMDVPDSEPVYARVLFHNGVLAGPKENRDTTPAALQGFSDALPHVDTSYIKDQVDIYGFASVGPVTRIYEGEFTDLPPDVFNFSDQIEAQGIEPSPLDQGSMYFVDTQTVHASPEEDPELIGVERSFLRMGFQSAEERWNVENTVRAAHSAPRPAQNDELPPLP